jgi:vesicle-associated membrane protein 72
MHMQQQQQCITPDVTRLGADYVVVTDEAAGRTIPNAFLDKVKDDFITKYADKGRTVKENGLSNYG